MTGALVVFDYLNNDLDLVVVKQDMSKSEGSLFIDGIEYHVRETREVVLHYADKKITLALNSKII